MLTPTHIIDTDSRKNTPYVHATLAFDPELYVQCKLEGYHAVDLVLTSPRRDAHEILELVAGDSTSPSIARSAGTFVRTISLSRLAFFAGLLGLASFVLGGG